MASGNARPRGRQFFFNPGPTSIPDRVLSAMHRPTVDFMAEEFLVSLRRVHADMRTVLKTRQQVLLYTSNGHGAWEASLANVFRPGENVLVLETGHFSANWAGMATSLGLEVETLHADWRRGISIDALASHLKADKSGKIKGILAVHNETSTGMALPIADVRRAMDEAKHPALLLVDTISSLASMDFRMDEWGVDICVGGSQKGLMMTTGLAFTGISDRAMDLSKRSGMPRSYWSWAEMLTREPQRFPGTTPVHQIFGLEEALKILLDEGMDAVVARHSRLAGAARAAVRRWGGDARSGITIGPKGLSGPVKAMEMLPSDPTRASDSVSAILLPDGFDGNKFRKIALDRFNLSLGGGLGPLAGRVFRIGHLGDLNEPMILGAIATIELSLREAGIPHVSGGTEAAIAALQAG